MGGITGGKRRSLYGSIRNSEKETTRKTDLTWGVPKMVPTKKDKEVLSSICKELV